MQKTQLTVQI